MLCRRICSRCVVIALVSGLGVLGEVVQRASAQVAAVNPAPIHHPNRVIVRFEPSIVAAKMQAADNAAGVTQVLKVFRHVAGLRLVEVPNVNAAIAAYEADPGVMYAEPDWPIEFLDVPNDSSFGLLWGMHNIGQTILGVPGVPGADINAVAAWDSWTGDPSFKIAVIDSGTKYDHVDLAGNFWTNPGEVPGNGVDDDGNGYIDDIHGYDMADNDGDPMDYFFHGTHVAGTIGAVGNNGIGVAGVNWQCDLVALKIGSATPGNNNFCSNAMGAMDYVIEEEIRVSNNSYGIGGFCQGLYDLIEAAQSVGHLFVAAAANNGSNNDQIPFYPATYDLLNVISVAAMNNQDQLAGFSNWGPTTVDVGAPGVNTYSSTLNGGYTYSSGTSMACPHVVGLVALVTSRYPSLTWQEVRARILDSVRPVPALLGKVLTGGVIDAYAALGDCNGNGVDDADDIDGGGSDDCNLNGIPDECEADCNENGIADGCDIADGLSDDCNENGVPDECTGVETDCDADGVPDECVLADGSSVDCNENNLPDECEGDFSIIDSTPVNGAIDARQPFDVDGGSAQGWSLIALSFSGPATTVDIEDLVITQEGGDGDLPVIVNLVHSVLNPQNVGLFLSPPINPGAWTTISLACNGTNIRLGYLPADVNNDAVSNASDVLALIDSLNGVIEFESYQTDTDRSGATNASDVLRVIDLLNGAGAYDPWLGVELPD